MKTLFCYAMDIGEQLLLCGAEVHRVEETVTRICTASGAQRVDVFIITSSMVVTVHTADGNTHTQTRRIRSVNFDFERLHYLNDLAHDICEKNLPGEEIKARLQTIQTCKRVPLWVEFICYAGIAAAFTLFFGGTAVETVLSLAIGLVVRLGLWSTDGIIANKVFGKFFATVIITALSFALQQLGWIGKMDTVIIGNIMTLIPGIGLTNAMRDLFTGDSIAGLLRTAEAALTALAIAAGYYLVAVFGGFAV